MFATPFGLCAAAQQKSLLHPRCSSAKIGCSLLASNACTAEGHLHSSDTVAAAGSCGVFSADTPGLLPFQPVDHWCTCAPLLLRQHPSIRACTSIQQLIFVNRGVKIQIHMQELKQAMKHGPLAGHVGTESRLHDILA